MSHLLRIFWLITLIFVAAGCSGYQTACYIRTEGSLESGQDIREICDLKPGDKVRVTLVDGIQVQGTVWSLSSSEIVIYHEDQSNKPTTYSSDQIYSIETESTGGSSSTTTTLLIVGGLVLIVGAVILANGLSELNNSFGN